MNQRDPTEYKTMIKHQIFLNSLDDFQKKRAPERPERTDTAFAYKRKRHHCTSRFASIEIDIIETDKHTSTHNLTLFTQTKHTRTSLIDSVGRTSGTERRAGQIRNTHLYGSDSLF